MIFTFPTSKTNEGFFFNRRFICSHSFRHNRDHKENSSIAQPSFPKNIETQEEIFHVEIDTWRFDRSVLWPLDGLQIDSFLHHFPQRAAMSKMYKLKKKMFIEMLLCHALWLVKNFLITSSTSQMQNYTYCVRFLRLLVAFVAAFVVVFFFFKVLRAPSDNLQHWMTPPDFRC